MGHEAILTFASVKEILWCDHSNESYWQYFPVVQFIILYKVVLLRLWMKSYGVTILRVTINTPGFDQ